MIRYVAAAGIVTLFAFAGGVSHAGPVTSGLVEFEAHPVSDSFLVYEGVYIVSTISNRSAENIPRSPFVVGEQFVFLELTNLDRGQELPVCGHHLTHPRNTVNANYILPFEEKDFAWDLVVHAACGVDSTSRFKVIPVGRYQVIVRWTVDLRDWLASDKEAFVSDTFEFTIWEGSQEDKRALQSLKGARLSKLAGGTISQYISDLWDVSEEFPSSRYAGFALNEIGMLMGTEPILPFEIGTFARRYITALPYVRRTAKYLDKALNEMNKQEQRRWLQFLSESYPKAPVGKAAHDRLVGEGEGNE